jgi:glycosyltransferase involved in cell wall biosynthesis
VSDTSVGIWFVVPGSIQARTGGYAYDRRIIAELRRRGWTIEISELEDSFPEPTAAALAGASRALARIPDGATVVVDGLAFGAMPAEVEREASRLRLVALVHLPLALEVGLDPDIALRREAGERRALAAASLVIATGRWTVPALERYGVGRHHIALVEPGTDRAPLAAGSGGSSLRLLCVATLNPGKGHEILIRALSRGTKPAADRGHRAEASADRRSAGGSADRRSAKALAERSSWHLTCAGSLTRHPPTVERIRALVRAEGLDDRVSLAGDLDAESLEQAYHMADLFVLATLRETYGMAVAEAIGHGLPIVTTATGAAAELVGPAEDGAGLLVAPGDEATLAAALSRVMTDTTLRQRLTAGARRMRERLPTWEDAGAKMADALERVATHA